MSTELRKLAEFDACDYAMNYEFRGDGGDYTPKEGERILIEDAVSGAVGPLIDAARALLDQNEKMRKALEDAHRIFMPTIMSLAEIELVDEPVKDDAVLFSFMGSGASDFVTVGEFRKALNSISAAISEDAT